ncbi:alcohol dehydrogenase catalytic domain-containing protein [Agrococcus sp. ARC_14]|uniref:zinc-binding dehydrogenase n=1 Tax=Agrococcus sp. ARC_14 TaxID=2919927 RepID=UPI001F069FC5|nr:alcohol dehydrogenase catalytic domain-containing protein [Agrococcus sp. ARC_14]MCH1881416.1 alcohol dehydrogenase catalytic domain-containing protein [Agrococcus sp. ARC_14]
MTLVERPTPQAEPGGVLLEVVVAGICGTDLKIARGEHRLFPEGTVRVPGHEFVGRVRENRSDRSDLVPGSLVAIAPNVGCGTCVACTGGRSNLCTAYQSVGLTFDGAFAETVAMPARAVEQGNLLLLPSGTDPVVGALVEPVAAVLRGIRAIGLTASDTLLISGAGPIGLIAVLIARQFGVEQILVSQTSELRRRLALEFGATSTIDPRAEQLPERVYAETGGRGADCVLVCTPAPSAFREALPSAALGGRINFFAGLPSGRGGVELDANLVHYRELIVTGSTANTTQDCVDALELLLADPEPYLRIVSKTYPLREIAAAMAAMAGGEALKAMVQP